MTNRLLVAAGVVVVVVGVIFALQGFGVIGGSAMSNNPTYEVVGPLVALAGLVLAVVGLRRRGAG
jgi:hypothetical protein